MSSIAHSFISSWTGHCPDQKVHLLLLEFHPIAIKHGFVTLWKVHLGIQVFSLFDNKKYFWKNSIVGLTCIVQNKNTVSCLSLRQLFFSMWQFLTSWGPLDFSLAYRYNFCYSTFVKWDSLYFSSSMLYTPYAPERWVHLLNVSIFTTCCWRCSMNLLVTGIFLKSLFHIVQVWPDFYSLSELSCVFTICSRKPTGNGYHCHSKKSWGTEKKKKDKRKGS